MKKSVKILALLLSFVFVMGAAVVPVSAAEEVVKPSKTEKTFFDFTDDLVNGLVSVIAAVIPAPLDWVSEASYKNTLLFPGTEKFLDTPAENAKWSLGYAQSSILDGQNVLDDSHFVSGGIALSPKYPTEIVDDSKVRVIAMSDGSGRGTAVFAVIDAYGLSNKDVNEIRSRVVTYAKKNGVVSINVAVLHQHSAVDTFGMNGDIVKGVFLNPLINLVNAIFDREVFKPFNGKNDIFQNNLFEVTVDTIETAIAQMEPGKLMFGSVDVSEYLRDKRPPEALRKTLDRFRFVPDDVNSEETWFSTSEIHCVGNGVQGTQITADYPYYMEKYVNDYAGANFMLLMGAELATSQRHEPFEGEIPAGKEGYMVLGEKLGEKLVSITNEKEVAPLLNIAHKEVRFAIENQIMLLAAKAGLFENQAVTNGSNVKVVSEIGYMELGTDLAVALVPGELEAALAYGGELGITDSWSGTEWTFDSMQQIVGDKRELLVFGLCNDQIGYIVPTNDYMPMLWEESDSIEFVSLGSQTAITYVNAFKNLVESK